MKTIVLYARAGALYPLAASALAAILGAPLWATVAAATCMAAVVGLMHIGGQQS